MQRKGEPIQPVSVEGNELLNFMHGNSMELKELLDKAKHYGRELKDIILFIALSILLLIGISLLPQSHVTVQEASATLIPAPTSIVKVLPAVSTP